MKKDLGLNNVVISGILQFDPTIDSSAGKNLSGCAKFNIKNVSFFGKDEDKLSTAYINVVLYGSKAERLGLNLRAGDEIIVEGRLRGSSITKENGDKYNYLEILAREIKTREDIHAKRNTRD